MLDLARPKRPSEATGSADSASHSRPVVQRRPGRTDLSLQLATRVPPGRTAGRAEPGAASDAAVHADGVRAIAERGMAGSAEALPHLSLLQPAFGAHDLRG